MKHFLIITFIAAVAITGKAQDQLFKKDNTKLLVKITEVSPEEIKYKLFSNLNGPIYVESKRDISLIIYENGQHEVINTPPTSYAANPNGNARPSGNGRMSSADSAKYFKYSESVSLNFMNLANMEVGMIYQKDFFKHNFNLIIPVAIGLDKPNLTQSVYYTNNYGNSQVSLNRKLFEVGLGLNYYPSLRYPVNYYIGPVFRYMQFSANQNYYYNYYPGAGTQSYYTQMSKNITVSRYCFSVTNGFIVRTRSRLMLNLFGSLGFKNDVLSGEIVDPNTNLPVTNNSNSLNLYLWLGFNIGFTF